MSRLYWTALLSACLMLPASVRAASVIVSGDDPRSNLTVAIEDATLDVVLKNLRDKYGFEVGGLQNAADRETLSATMSGSLQSILERLLRNWNHMIVRSPDNRSGIAKVMILDSAYGSLRSDTSQQGQPGVSETRPDKLLQAFSNGAAGSNPAAAAAPGRHSRQDD